MRPPLKPLRHRKFLLDRPTQSTSSKRRRYRAWNCRSGKFRRRCKRPPPRDIERSGALDLSDFLNRRLNGVTVNEIQGNPFQPDINYRGYTASPLLGTPQGLSVYMDGVRLNQPFGEVMSWDLIPALAISSTTLMPGSNPLFGLNTLGGALSIQTKSGLDGARHDGRSRLRQRRAAGRRVRTRRRKPQGPALVSRGQPLRRRRLARRLAVRGPSVLRQAWLAAARADDVSLTRRARGQFD